MKVTVRASLFSIFFVLLAFGELLSLVSIPNASGANTSTLAQHAQPVIAWTRTLTNGTWQSVAATETGVYAVGVWGVDRYDVNGNRVWGQVDTFASSVAVSSDGVYVVVGPDLLRKYDFNGTQLWTVSF